MAVGVPSLASGWREQSDPVEVRNNMESGPRSQHPASFHVEAAVIHAPWQLREAARDLLAAMPLDKEIWEAVMALGHGGAMAADVAAAAAPPLDC
mmetsp:Transcript_53899/g.128368  ORF Transcript_53899/g.128368 Transcript_53899/m.128368 type:complete len:95 (+) Transcript_53899:418-702(+)